MDYIQSARSHITCHSCSNVSPLLILILIFFLIDKIMLPGVPRTQSFVIPVLRTGTCIIAELVLDANFNQKLSTCRMRRSVGSQKSVTDFGTYCRARLARKRGRV